MIGVGTNYRTVAVIGCQSSGKSKLRYNKIILQVLYSIACLTASFKLWEKIAIKQLKVYGWQ